MVVQWGSFSIVGNYLHGSLIRSGSVRAKNTDRALTANIYRIIRVIFGKNEPMPKHVTTGRLSPIFNPDTVSCLYELTTKASVIEVGSPHAALVVRMCG